MVYPVAAPRRVAVGAALLIVLVALAAGGKAVLFDTLDPDCFLHLLAADQLLTDGIGLLVDHQSFASVPRPWPPYSWLAELGMKLVWDHGGYRGAILTHALTSAALVALIAAACVAKAPRLPLEDDDLRPSYDADDARPATTPPP